MPEASDLAIGILYALVAPLWTILSLWTRAHARPWAVTPRWHGWLAPAFRGGFLVTRPVEAWLTDRAFIWPVFPVGALATVSWLAWRSHYLLHAPRPLPRGDSIHYNLAYMANLVAFGLACHSFVCVVVAVNVNAVLLLVRERCDRRLADTWHEASLCARAGSSGLSRVGRSGR